MAALKVGEDMFFASSVTGHGSDSFTYDWLTPKVSNLDPSQASDPSPKQAAALEHAGVTQSELDLVADILTDIELQLEACRIQQMQRKQTMGASLSSTNVTK